MSAQPPPRRPAGPQNPSGALDGRLVAALICQVVLAVVDAALGEEAVLTGLFLLAPLAIAATATPRAVVIVALAGVMLAIASGWWNDYAGSAGHILRVAIVAAGGVFAALTAQARERAAKLARVNAMLATELDETRERLHGILGALAEAVTVHDTQGAVVYANRAAADLLGAASVEEVLSSMPGELAVRYIVTHEDGTPVEPHEYPGRRLLAGLDAAPLLTRFVRRDTGESRWLLTKATELRDARGGRLAINVIEDVTEAKEAELRQRFLAEAGRVLAASLDYEDTLEYVARLAVPDLADWCAVDLPGEHGTVEHVALTHADPAKIALGHELRRRYPPDPSSPTGVAAILRGAPALLIPEVTDTMLTDAVSDPEQLRLLREVGMRSAMIVPMRLGDETLGAISFVSADSGRIFDADDFAFAQDLALRAAAAVRNAQLYAEQSRVAHTLQAGLLPARLPEVPGWAAHADYQPGEQGAEVGGDFYDIVPVRGGHIVIVGDVTGKGIDAAALTALVRHTARTAARFDNRPGAVLAEIDRALREQPTLSPVTAVCARLDEGEPPRMTLAVGGHPLPLLKRDGQPPRALGGHGLLLGVVADGHWEESEVPLSHGDTVLFFTDGVTEAPGDGGRFGDARLAAAVAGAPPDPEGLLGALRDALAAYTTGTATDDRAMLALRLEGEVVAATATLSAEQHGSGAAPRAPQIRRMPDGARRPRALR